MGENTMLSIDEETTSSSQWSSAHFEKLNGRIRCENEVLIGSNEHKNDGESTANDHPVGTKGNGDWSKNGAQVDPSSDRWRQLTNALFKVQCKKY